jgi:hypothetical protein
LPSSKWNFSFPAFDSFPSISVVSKIVKLVKLIAGIGDKCSILVHEHRVSRDIKDKTGYLFILIVVDLISFNKQKPHQI